MKKRENIRIIVGTITGIVSGLFFGTAILGIAQATNEPWAGSYIDVIIYLVVGVVTGIVFGAFAKPSYQAIQGGALGGIVAVGLKSVSVLLGTVEGDIIVKIFSIFNASIIGFGLGAMIGALVWLVSYAQQKITLPQTQNEHSHEFLTPTPKGTKVKFQPQNSLLLPERKFRVKGWQIFLGFIPLIYFIPVTLVLIGFSIWFVSDLFQKPNTQLFGFVMLACLGPGSLFAGIFCFYLITMPLFYTFGTYLKVSSEGLEYLRWPYFGLRCGWADVDRLGKSRMTTGRVYDILYLRRSEPFSWQLSTKIRQKFGMSTNWSILLSDLQGWPVGQLADDLRRYAPHIFSEDKTEERR